MNVNNLRNRVKRMEKSLGLEDSFSEFMEKYLELIGNQPDFLPCEAENIEVDRSEFEQLFLDYPKEVQKLDKFVNRISHTDDEEQFAIP